MAANWSKWSSIAEILSSVAIVATLLYLAVQTQQNSEAIRASARHAMIESDLQLVTNSVDNPVIIEAMTKDMLTRAEMIQLQNWLVGLVRSREHQWFLYQDGLLDEGMWEAYLTGLSANLSSERTRLWWGLVGHEWFDDEFATTVDEYLATIPLSSGRHPMETVQEMMDRQ